MDDDQQNGDDNPGVVPDVFAVSKMVERTIDGHTVGKQLRVGCRITHRMPG